MHFTVVFEGPEHLDLSFGLVFLPCPVWVRGQEELLNLHPDTPQLQPGAVKRLLALPALGDAQPAAGSRVTIVVHPSGEGTAADLETLRQDLANESFRVDIVGASAAVPTRNG